MNTSTWLRRAAGLGMLAAIALMVPVSAASAAESPPENWLNMRIAPVPKALDAQLELKGEGVLVEHVGAGGPADKAGIQPNDVLLKANDKPVLSSLKSLIAEGKEFNITLLRAGKSQTVAVTPAKAELSLGPFDVALPKNFEDKEKVVREKLSEIEKMVREKLKDAGIDNLRMQFLQPGRIFPPGFPFPNGPPEFPDDLTITIHKHGKSPAEIEVKKGDQTWTAKEDDLAVLPDEVRPQVEAFLGRGPRFNMTTDRRHWRDGAGPPPGHPDGPPPDGPDGAGPGRRPPSGPGGPPPGFGRGPREPGGPDDGPDGPPGPPDERGPRRHGSLERRLDELSGNLNRMREQLDELRRGMHDERRRGD
jgi:hypothetical protein